MTTLAVATKLRCERDDRCLFADLSFSVSQGDILHIKGANGAGKTTLLRRLVGLNSFVEGDVQFHPSVSERGQRIDGQRFWYLAHRPAVTLAQTALENLRYAVALQQQTLTRSAYWQALADVGLAGYEDVPAHRLSSGQQQRIALARLYLPLPDVKLWLLDEPFNALDANASAQLEVNMLRFVEGGGSVILISHHEFNHASVQELVIGQANQSVKKEQRPCL
ncbi:cytochrome c biogenesis heme-transporting ATPase CcmA [Reinekea thalattae]|uniref:Cytochrome c biogenesis heme-transporting ATPase CcmA n=1 Tax=Reinekea thalattae TaxID=2593301 RepID=A0A5C8Z705_9GAMM|nr:cytochrome c biogenesis heme-transporting ATPase CcmA [Reinekea thalattae]TXR53732.1 cytochrome c biogenesis heme-transporting ATPase CcmA [Reinekea thalattae]